MKTKNVGGLVLAALLILGILGMTVWAVKAYQTPLGPALQIPTPTSMPILSNQIIPTNVPVVQIVPTAIPTTIPTAIPTFASLDVCGENAVWNILILGSDAGDMRGDKGSDLTRMARVDFVNKRVTIFSFSRDLWVDTVGLNLNNPTISAAQLGTVFYEGRIRSPSLNAKTMMLDGTRTTAQMLTKNFLISTDHYLTVDLAQIPAMIDAIGGVPINIPVATTDPWIGTVIPAGQQTLNGSQFVAYARAIPDSDFGRIERNNLLLKALQQKLLDPAVWVKIPQLYSQFSGAIVTDLSPEQINHLTCLLKEVPQESIIQDGVRPEWTSPGPQPGSLFWNKTSVLNRLRELGLIP